MIRAASGGSARPPASRPPTAKGSAASSRPAGGPRRKPPAAPARTPAGGRNRPTAHGLAGRRRTNAATAPVRICAACGGHRSAHTVHHDQAAHDRARRRYDGLHAKAASTGFPQEAAACRAKAEQLRAKYGL
jgi:hypothetical protein